MKYHGRKRLQLILTLLLIVCIISAGDDIKKKGKQNCFQKEEKETGFVLEKKVILFSWWGKDAVHEKFLQLVEKFEKDNPDIDVQCQFGAWGDGEDYLSYTLEENKVADVSMLDFEWLERIEHPEDFFYRLQIKESPPVWKWKPEKFYSSKYPHNKRNMECFSEDYSTLSIGYLISKKTKYPKECERFLTFLWKQEKELFTWDNHIFYWRNQWNILEENKKRVSSYFVQNIPYQ